MRKQEISLECYKFLRTIFFKLFGRIWRKFEPPFIRDVSYGTNFPDKHFLVIRRNDSIGGLFSFVLASLGWIKYAFDKGMIPIVDMQSHLNIYLKWSEIFRVNAWEFFFEQPSGYSLKDIRKAKNVTVIDGYVPVARSFPADFLNIAEHDHVYLATWRCLYNTYIKVKPNLLINRDNAAFEACINNGVIGVLARGTDYAKEHPSGHPIQPTATLLIDKVNELLKGKFSGYKVYLVTEDAFMVQSFQKAFEEKLILSYQDTIDYKEGLLVDCLGMRHNIERGIRYLKAIYDLSRCQCLVAGRTCGSIGAVLGAHESQYRYIFDLGTYP